MNFKNNTYYIKPHFNGLGYCVYYVTDNYVYLIAECFENMLLKCKHHTIGSIEHCNKYITDWDFKIKEISKEDLFLKLL